MLKIGPNCASTLCTKSTQNIENNNESAEGNVETFLKTLNFEYKTFYNSDLTQIVSLNLSNCNLSFLPSYLKVLPLKCFNLSSNCLGEIPQCFYLGLDELEILDLSHNDISVFIVEPNCCGKLESLNLSNNKFKDIPEWIMNHRAKNLTELKYDFNKITHLKCIFNDTKNFPIQKLRMKNCIMRDIDLKFLKDCSNLTQLDISNTEVVKLSNVFQERRIDAFLLRQSWRNMQVLNLSNLGISIFPNSVLWLESLAELYMSHNNFHWLPKDGFEYLVNLEILDLSHNAIDEVPEKLAWLEYLKVLKLSHNEIAFVPDLSNMKSLEVLDLYHNCLCSFNQSNIVNLRCVDLEMNYFDTRNCLIVDYAMKNSTYMEMIEEFRARGEREMAASSDSSYCVSSDEDGIFARSADVQVEAVSETWDEEAAEKPADKISKSDEEWEIYNENIINKSEAISTNSECLTYNENVIFCDAD